MEQVKRGDIVVATFTHGSRFVGLILETAEDTFVVKFYINQRSDKNSIETHTLSSSKNIKCLDVIGSLEGFDIQLPMNYYSESWS